MFHFRRHFQTCIPCAFFLAALVLVLNDGRAGAMRSVGGADPVADGPWPDGAVDVANLKSRFRFSSGDGGDDEFLYRGDTLAFQQALAVFAKVRAPALELVVHVGPFLHWIAKEGKDDGHIDWAFTLYNPEEWHAIYNNPQSSILHGENKPVPAPRIDVYVGALPVGIDWAQITVPGGITVKDERAAGPKKTTPVESLFHGVIYNMANGKTIGGARLEAQQYDRNANQWKAIAAVTAGATGAYRIEKLPAGQYRLVASAKGFAGRVLYNQVVEPDVSLRLDGELSGEVIVKGAVTDEQDQPLKDAKVHLESALGIDGRSYDLSQDLEAQTDAGGHFSFAGVPTGYAQFQCTATGYKQLQPRTLHRLASWHRFNANQTEVILTGDVRVDLRMALPGTVHCKVTSANEIPLDRNTVNVTLAEADGGHASGLWSMRYQSTSAIDENGNAKFTDLQPGRYFVVVGYWVDIPETQIITVNAGKSTEVKLVATMPPKRAPAQEEAPKPLPPPKPPATDDKF